MNDTKSFCQKSINPEEPIEVLDFESDRYASLKLIPWWQQEKLANAKVMVIGTGALGNEVLKNLALLGIGYVFIIDLDIIEASNLTRSILFRETDRGKPKAMVAAQRLKEINPDIKVSFHQGNVTTDIGLGIFRRMDIIICCVDNIAARVFINRACWKVAKPWINGGIDEMQGVMEVFVPPDSSCYECTMTDIDYQLMNRRHPCGLPTDEITEGKVPTTPTIASIIAALQVQEALKLIHQKQVQGGVGLTFYGTTNEYLQVSYPRVANCPAHFTLGPILPLDRKTQDITFGDLLNEAKKELGDEIFLELDFDLVYGLSCICGARSEVLRRRETLTRNDLTCIQCGEIMQMDMTSTVSWTNRRLLDKTLADGGIPPLDIVSISNSNSSSYVYYELAGDEKLMLSFM